MSVDNNTKIRLVICGTIQQCEHYLRQIVTNPHFEEKSYRVSVFNVEACNGDERILFVTPDQEEKIMGLRIDSYIERGTPYINKNYSKFMDRVVFNLKNKS